MDVHCFFIHRLSSIIHHIPNRFVNNPLNQLPADISIPATAFPAVAPEPKLIPHPDSALNPHQKRPAHRADHADFDGFLLIHNELFIIPLGQQA
jgi:hypothetical protein